jgi:hypothetical protein
MICTKLPTCRLGAVQSKPIDNLIFLTYEYKIVLALAGYNYFDKIFGEISYYFSGDTISIAVK